VTSELGSGVTLGVTADSILSHFPEVAAHHVRDEGVAGSNPATSHDLSSNAKFI
jgi:hypothetical protein